MKSYKKSIYFIFLSVFNSISSIVIERYTINSIRELQIPLHKNMLVIFDLDDTLILDDHYNLPVVLVESQSHSIFEEVRNAHIPILSITAREIDKEQQLFTLNQMKQLGFTFTHFYGEHDGTISCILVNNQNNKAFYNNGIIFVHGSNKGTALHAFLESLDNIPTTIIMVDDKPYNNDAIQKVFENSTLPGLEKVILYDYPYVKNNMKHLGR